MKQTTLEDLYYGNINPCEISFLNGSEYGKCFDKSNYACLSIEKLYNKVIYSVEV